MITLSDGRPFPCYQGEALSWSIGLYHTFGEQQLGFPRMRAVIRAMLAYRRDQLEREWREAVRDSFGRMFGQNAKVVRDVIEQEMAAEK